MAKMTEAAALKRANQLNRVERGTNRYWAVMVLYNWVIYKAPNGIWDKAYLHIV